MTTETNVQNLKINTMTQAQYATITPSATELYMVTDAGSNYAFNDFSNVDSTGKKTANNWGIPNYSAGISMGLPTSPINTTTDTFTCPSAGMIAVAARKTNFGTSMYLRINNINVAQWVAYAAIDVTQHIPVAKDDVVLLVSDSTTVGDWYLEVQTFYPLKGEA